MSAFLSHLGEFAIAFAVVFFGPGRSLAMKERIIWATLFGLGTSGVLSYIF